MCAAVGVPVTTQGARGLGCVLECNRGRSIGSHNIGVEVDQSLAADSCAGSAHSVRGVARGAGKPVGAHVRGMACPRSRGEYQIQIVALRAHGIGPIHREIGTGKQV